MPFEDQEEFDPELSVIGKRETKRRLDMSVMSDIMNRAGWTKALEDGENKITQSNLSPPEKIQTGIQWKADVQKLRQEVLDLRAEHMAPKVESDSSPNHIHGDPNKVEVVDKSYHEQTSNNHSSSKISDSQILIGNIVQQFNLNREQERAFCIISDHACTPQSEQLKMYIGGMGGTGKTQVLKALIQFFTARNASHRFIVVAPTGSAAALLAGSTYHSFFGFDERSDEQISNVKLAQVKSRMRGIEYVFFDEVSMLSCRDLY